MDQDAQQDIFFEKNHRCGVMTLNRPKALNAFSHDMVRAVQKQYAAWEKDNEIYCVIQKSSSERAFCAGADVRVLYKAGLQDPAQAKAFFYDEYALNWQLDRFTKPNIAFIDGIVMGGGVGISQHGTHRVAGKNYRFAMPETAIGLFPDIGAAQFLSRLPLNIGMYLGLTGNSINAADAHWLKLITHYIPMANRRGIEEALSEGIPVDQLLEDASDDPGDTELKQLSQWIGSAFSAGTVECIMERLENISGDAKDWAQSTLKTLAEKSPLSLKVTHAHIRAGENRNLKRVLKADYDLVCRFMDSPDFFEGVRARLIDKDFAPKWQHETIDDVGKEDVQALLVRSTGDEAQRLELV